jgi:hypothetical protein
MTETQQGPGAYVEPMGRSAPGTCPRTGGKSKGQCLRSLGHADITTVYIGHNRRLKSAVHVNQAGETWQ